MIEDFLLCLVLGIITSAGITYFVAKKFLGDMWRGADSILGSFLIVVALIDRSNPPVETSCCVILEKSLSIMVGSLLNRRIF